MASDRILALNIGAGQVTLGEFRVSSGRNPELVQYGSAPLGLDPDSDMDPSGFIIAALQDVMKSTGIRPGPLMMTVSGKDVFPRFVKLPTVAKDKIRTMIQAEAEQNVPFPIDELTWDYQLIGSDDMGEQNAMIVAAKTESIATLTNSISASGLEPEVVDVAPLAIYNCVTHCYPDEQGCVMVLDIGSRSTNLLFIEEGKVFYRSIPVAGNTITQEIAKTFQIDFRQAEQMKKATGFVALGGVTSVDDEEADRMSKCIRAVMTRLHAEVNRSINFYRSQQGGSPPARVLLTGGGACLQNADTFFTEKLRIDVSYLNPFTNVQLGPRVNAEKASSEFYELSEVVGLAVRKSGSAKVSINLMPPNLADKKAFRRRIPFFAFSGVALIASAFLLVLCGMGKKAIADEFQKEAASKLSNFEGIRKSIKVEADRRDAVVAELSKYSALVNERTLMLQRLDAIRKSLLPGLWLVSVEMSEDGATMTLVCRGFSDQLKDVESKAGGSKTAPEIFKERLSAQAEFSENIEIVQQKDADGLRNKVREFKLSVGIDENHRFGKAE